MYRLPKLTVQDSSVRYDNNGIKHSLIVGVVETLSTHFFGADTIKISVWGFLLAVLIIKPQGLFGHTRIGKGKF